MFGLLDRNHDGVLDDVEIREAPDALRKLDRDGDGKVSIREAFGPLDRQPGRPEFEPRPRHGEGDQPEPGDRPRGPREGDERGERRGPRGEGPRPSRPPSQ